MNDDALDYDIAADQPDNPELCQTCSEPLDRSRENGHCTDCVREWAEVRRDYTKARLGLHDAGLVVSLYERVWGWQLYVDGAEWRLPRIYRTRFNLALHRNGRTGLEQAVIEFVRSRRPGYEDGDVTVWRMETL